MEFKSRLKRRHLIDLILYLKSAQGVKAKIQEDEEQDHNPVKFHEACLFNGLMVNENVGLHHAEKHLPQTIPEITSVDLVNKRKALLEPKPKQILAYNPVLSHHDLNLIVEKKWSPTLI